MPLDYPLLLDNIKRRRYDEAIRDHILSPAFLDETVDESIKYAMESIFEVDASYAYKVYANTRRIQEFVTKALQKRDVEAVVRYHGPLRTDTHIRLYGEVNMLFLLKPDATHKNVLSLGQLLKETCAQIPSYGVDYGDGMQVRITTQKPTCKINLIPCAWINNPQFMETRNEIYRGIVIYNFKEKTRKRHLPFLNMARMNAKDVETSGGYKAMVRLLKSLANDHSVSLTNYELNGLVYRIPDDDLKMEEGSELYLIPQVKKYIQGLINDPDIIEVLLSPSEKELVFGNKEVKLDALKKLDNVLDTLIHDLEEVIGQGLSTPVIYERELLGHDA